MTHSEDSAMRTHAEDAFHNSEERTRLILDSAAEAICGCDSLGNCLFANSSAARMLAYDDPTELIGKNMHSMEHHTRKDGTPYPIEECPIYMGFQKGEAVHRDDEIFWRRDGTSFPVEYWSHLVVREGKTLGAVITFIDITERKQVEEALRNSEREFRTIIEAIPAFVVSALPDGSVDFLSQSLLDYTGLSREQWLGWGWRNIAHPEDVDRAVNKWLVALTGGEPLEVEVRYRRADGKYRWYLGRQVPLRDEKGNIVKWYGTLHDIEDRKRAEAALRKSEERNRSLLQINNAIITNLTQQALLHSISEALHRVISFDRCAITIYQPERDTFRFLAVEGDLLSDYFRAGQEDSRSETCASWVFEHQRPLVRRDLEKEGQYANERRLVAEGIQSMCAFPLVLQGKCIGTLSLVSRGRDRYSDEDAEFLQEVANQVVLAIQNMQSYQEIDSLKARLEKENVYLREELRTEHNFEEIVGNSPAVLRALGAVDQVAPTDATVLIYGETGTGKELVARAIHNRSRRNGRALVNVNCSAISAGLVESELFGHMKGSLHGGTRAAHRALRACPRRHDLPGRDRGAELGDASEATPCSARTRV